MRNIFQVGTQNALSATTATAVSLTIPSSSGTLVWPTHAIIQIVGASVRWRADGTAPTASSGILVPAGANIEFMDLSGNFESLIKNFQAIGVSGTATIEVAFFAS